jgi:hypothetical protein
MGHSPPECPEGWATGPPDFVGVGVQKCGTTWWHDLIVSHPGVFAPDDVSKELHFFDRFWVAPFDAAAVADYHRWFPRPPGALTGEWTPRYLHDVWSPPLLVRAAPEARLLVMVRDPLTRFRSGRGHEQRRRRPDPMIGGDAFRRGCYGEQLEHLFRLVPQEQVLVLQYEACVERPAPELARTYRFLGLDDMVEGVDLSTVRNPSPDLVEIDPVVEAELRERYLEDLVLLNRLVPSVELDRWPTWTGAVR